MKTVDERYNNLVVYLDTIKEKLETRLKYDDYDGESTDHIKGRISAIKTILLFLSYEEEYWMVTEEWWLSNPVNGGNTDE